MIREVLDKLNDVSDRLNHAKMMNELVYHATLSEPETNPHINYGANKVTMILRDVDTQLDAIADSIRTAEGLEIPNRRKSV